MTNEKELREEFIKEFLHTENDEQELDSMSDFWLSKLHSHTKEVVEKIKSIPVLHRDIILRSQMNDLEAVKYYPSSAKNALLIPRDEVLDLLASLEDNKK